MKIDNKTIGQILLNKRKQQRLSRKEVARILGISESHYVKFELGLRNINDVNKILLMKLFDLELEDFFKIK